MFSTTPSLPPSKLLVNDPSNRKCFPTFEQMRDIMNAGGFGGNGWKSISIDGHTIKDLRLILAGLSRSCSASLLRHRLFLNQHALLFCLVGGPAPGAISNDVHIDLSFSMWPTDEEFHAWLGAAKRKWRAQRKARKAVSEQQFGPMHQHHQHNACTSILG